MQKLLYVFIFGLGILIYVLMIPSNKSVFEKILLCEVGSAALIFSSISMLRSVKDENDEGN